MAPLRVLSISCLAAGQGQLMKAKPIIAGFLSYVHADDEYDNGRISRLRQRLELAIRVHSGFREFTVFQDREGIGWGQRWQKVIAESIDHSVVLFPVVTPLYFSSASCREEILAFEKRQTKLERDDLILPIYYLFSEMMDDLDGVSTDETKVAELLKRIQFEDWRAFRQTEETDPAYVQAIERLAQRAFQL